MNALYLKRLEICNFRAFGPTFAFDVPPGPSVSIIYGMNGLGKTTFFEAMEWGLTGDVRRLSSQLEQGHGKLGRYLTRRGAPDQSHRVALEFSDGEGPIVRTAELAPNAQELVSRFKLVSWRPNIEDVTPYFRLTMFLPQSRKHRFEEEKASEKWKLLEGPAGVQRLERIRQALGSQKAANAFKRSISDAQTQLDARISALERWIELLTYRSKILARCNAEAEVSSEKATEYLKGVIKSIAEIAGKEIDASAFNPIDIVETFEQLHSIVEENRESVESRRLQFSVGQRIIEEYAETSVSIKAYRDSLAATAQSVTKIREILTESDTSVADCTARLLQSEESHAKESRALAELRLVREALLDTAKYQSQIEEQLKQAEQLNSEITIVQGNIDRGTELLQQDRELQGKLTTLLDEIKAVEAEIERYTGWQEAASVRNTIASDLDALNVADEALKADQLREVESRTTVQSQIEELTEVLRVELERASRLERSVADVVALIEDSTSNCPVCTTPFDRGTLKKIAKESLDKKGIGNKAVADQIAEKKASRDQIEVTIKDLTARISANGLRRLQLSSELQIAQTALIEMERFSLGRGVSPEEILGVMDGSRKQKEQELESLKASRKALDPSIQTSVISDRSALRKLQEKGEQNTRLLSELQAKLQESQAMLSPLKSIQDDPQDQKLETVEDSISDAVGLVAELLNAKRAAQEAFSLKTQERELNKTELDRLTQLQDSDRLKLNEQLVRMDSLLERWKKIGFDDVPAMSVLEESRLSLENRSEAVEHIQNELRRLTDGYNAWLAKSELAEHDIVLAEARGANLSGSFEEVTIGHEGYVTSARAELNRRMAVAARAKAIADALKDKAEEFNEQALKPLEQRIQQFHEVLSPFRYSIRLQTKSRASNATRLEQTVSHLDAQGQESSSPPFAELSDGQLAVQGLSTLLAASVEYNWCRWPALLLDDPLQSSDLIHASAFIDIMRGLVKDLGYQIFISSHDLDEAEFIARKCERSNIVVGRCHLLGPGINGVRYEHAS